MGGALLTVYILLGLVFLRWVNKKLDNEHYTFPNDAVKIAYFTFIIACWLPFAVAALAHRVMGR